MTRNSGTEILNGKLECGTVPADECEGASEEKKRTEAADTPSTDVR